MDTKITTVTTRQYTQTFDRAEIIVALRSAGMPIPDNAEVTVAVPGGGDWSSTDLDISKRSPLVVTWTTTETE